MRLPKLSPPVIKTNKLNLINLSGVVVFGVSWCGFQIPDFFEKSGI
jgi:hypothetical protein